MSTRVSHPRKWAILALVLAAECMDLLDGTIVNVAAPTIRADLHSSTSALQWIIGGYALAFAVGLITGGRLGDIYGRKRLFVLGAIGFVVASMACAFAVSPEMLIALPARPGRRRGAADPARVGDHPRCVRACGTAVGVRRLRTGNRAVRGARADHRRRARRRQPVWKRLAADLLRQPAAWPDRSARRGAPDPRVSRA